MSRHGPYIVCGKDLAPRVDPNDATPAESTSATSRRVAEWPPHQLRVALELVRAATGDQLAAVVGRAAARKVRAHYGS